MYHINNKKATMNKGLCGKTGTGFGHIAIYVDYEVFDDKQEIYKSMGTCKKCILKFNKIKKESEKG